MYACRYMEVICLAAMLATKRSVGLTPEVSLRECVRLPTLTLKSRGHATSSPKTWVSMAPQKGLMPSKNFKNIY